MLFEGQRLTGFDENDDQEAVDDDENSVAVMCHTALCFLSQIIGDEILDHSFNFV
jgi:hypothetical protein